MSWRSGLTACTRTITETYRCDVRASACSSVCCFLTLCSPQAMDYQAWTVEAGMAYVTMATLVPALHVWWRAPHYRRRCDSYANKVWKIYAESNLNGCVLLESLPRRDFV